MKRALRRSVSALVVLLAVGVSATQQNEAEREKVERVPDVLNALGARDGAHIADLGSAEGFYTLRIARAVAPSGRAYAVDIDAKLLERLKTRAAEEKISNIEAILGETADPKLPADALDAVLIRNTYHEMPEYKSILAAVHTALKSKGLLVVIEALHENNRQLSRAQQVKEHEISLEIVEAELREAGFEIVDRDESFTRFTRPPPGGFWMLRGRRP